MTRGALIVLSLLALPQGVSAEPASLNDTQQLGLRLFTQSCAVCHTKPQLTSGVFGPVLSKDSAGGRDDVMRDLADRLHERRGAARAVALVAPGDDLSGEVGRRDADPGAADVDADDVAGGGVDLVQHRRAAEGRAGGPYGADHPGTLQVGQRLRDGRLGQPSDAREVGPRGGPGGAQVLEHRPLVVRAEEARRASSPTRGTGRALGLTRHS